MEYALPDGTELALPDGATGADAAAAIGPGLARAALAVKVDGSLRDLTRPLPDERNGSAPMLEILTDRSGPEALALIRHDAAHVLAAAVLELYPGVAISIGPAIENGFYYDFEFPRGVTVNDADFPRIEAAMQRHIDADEHFERAEVPVAEALERFRGQGQPYKIELIEDLIRNAGPDHPLESVSLYTNGAFTDLCLGPHSPSTKRIKAFSCSRWPAPTGRGDADRQMLTRVYGTAFFSAKDLDAYLEAVERARANDHRRLGPALGLFGFSDAAPGMTFWYPAGAQVFNSLVSLSRRDGRAPGLHRGQDSAALRQLAVEDVRALGQVPRAHVRDRVRRHADGAEADELPRSRAAVLDAPAFLSGSARALLRAGPTPPQRAQRHAARAAAHPSLRPGRRPHLLHRRPDPGGGGSCLEFGFAVYEIFGLDVRLELSTRPEQRIGSDAIWDHSEAALTAALDQHNLEYELHAGDGAFYGPKIDMHMTDSLGRSWQLGTVQLDYNFPERFELVYTGADNAEHRPVMIHRALFGSFERFIGSCSSTLGESFRFG